MRPATKKLLIYIFSLLLFGLLQVWVVALILVFKQTQFTLLDVVSDGGLFFFASSLAITNLINHSRIFRSIDAEEIIWSFSFCVVIVIVCSVGYATAFTIDPQTGGFKFELNVSHHYAQFGSAFLCLVYSVFTEIRLHKRTRHT